MSKITFSVTLMYRCKNNLLRLLYTEAEGDDQVSSGVQNSKGGINPRKITHGRYICIVKSYVFELVYSINKTTYIDKKKV